MKKIILSHDILKTNQLVQHMYNCLKKDKNLDIILLSPSNLQDEDYLKEISKNNKTEVLLVPYDSPNSIIKVLKFFKNIKWIQSSGIGIDLIKPSFHLIKNRDIEVTNMKNTSSLALAEWSILASLYFTKNTYFFLEKAKKKEWVEKIECLEIMTNKKCLIIGLGSIGCSIAKKCYYGFNMKITGVKKNINSIDKDIKNILENLITLENIENCIHEFDYIYLSLPGVGLNDFINKKIIKKMKKGVIIVNVGRGDVLHINDIFWGIKENIIKGVGLDVWDKEPISLDSPFYNDKFIHDRILNYCHKASLTTDIADNRIEIFKENLERYFNKKQLLNIVDLDKGY